ncbi:ParB/RepB/Spo0J family partition protein [candidate division WWE3 bacterium]|uniref:ParB/RepB/Spo0J family partition protein n=1 Tax=candidate division WWE3 bacterium TaxID=2053526 RepID=A0A955LL94_UNCKA|nr:ParB/RepB/Spo0J family partition protein [candidate division WWE3 bacterium]
MPDYSFAYVKIDSLLPNPLKPRSHIDRDSLMLLVESIRQYGLFTPLLVGKTNAGLQIIAGERRWRAAKIAGLDEVPTMQVDATPLELVLLFLEENLQREQVNLIELASAMRMLLKRDGFTLKVLGSRLKMTEDKIDDVLQVLELPSQVQEDYLAGAISDERLLELTKVEDPIVLMQKSKSS